ncbi:MAG: radical SAM protein [Magnetococcales bacterium]|nr:radical SAM protein [Magnetococcales bacterium]
MDFSGNHNLTRSELDCLHAEFDRVLASPWRQRALLWRMHANRISQSAYILLRSYNIIPKILKGVAAGLMGQSPTLRSLELAVTYRCNAKCEQCSCRLEMDMERERKEHLTVDEYKNAIDQAREMGAFQFLINGGEPMLGADLVFDLIAYIKQNKQSYVHLCTNGYLLNQERIDQLANLHLDSVEMGLDSAFPEIHDANRMPGSFQKIMESTDMFRKHGILVIYNTVLTNQKVQSDDILLTCQLAAKNGCLLQITPACLTGSYKNRLDLLLTDKTKLYFIWLLSKYWSNRSDLYSSLTNIRCPAAREKIGLQPYGDVVSCPLIQIPYGNIRHTPLREIQAKMLLNPYYHLKETQGCLPSMSETFIREYLLDPPHDCQTPPKQEHQTAEKGK